MLLRSVLCATLALVVAPNPAAAGSQGNTGSLGGTVRDEQRLPAPGATVTIAAADSMLTRTVVAGPDGGFEFPGLLPGEYVVATELPGFRREQVRVALAVNQRVRVEIVLRAAGVAQQVDVRATPPLLHPTDAAVGEVIDQQQVAELPLNGRQFMELALLVPGAHTAHGAQMGNMSPLYWRPGQSSAITISGGRPGANMYLLDGTTNTDPSFNTYVINLSPDSIREFQIQTGTYTAELGGAGTGQVNVVTKSGTRDLHGSIYEYLRNSAFDSPLFTDPELPHFSQNQYGGTLGGPAGGRVFFFGAFEGLRSTQGQSNIMSVPLAARRLGDFSGGQAIYDPLTTRANPAFDSSKPSSPANAPLIRTPFPGNQIPLNRMDPVALQILQRFVPLPNLAASTNNYLDTRAQRIQNDSYNLRLDRSWAGGSSVFGRYSLGNEKGFTPENLPGFGAFHDNRVQNFTFTAVNPISRRFVNETRLGIARMRLHRYGETANGADLVTELGIPGVGFGGSDAFGLPRFDVQGYDPIGDSLLCTPCRYWNTNIQIGERFTWSEGRHSVRVGGDVRRFVWDMLGFFQNRGYFQFTPGLTSRTSLTDGTGDALASFLLGYPALAQRQAGIPSMNMRQTALDLFVQDDWRVSPSLTINAGLRYEVQTPLTDTRKILTNLDFSSGVPVAFVGGQNGYPKGLVYADRNNLAPRAGVAWAPGDHRHVLRAGYGVFYSYPDMNLWCNQVHNVPLVFPEIRASTTVSPAIRGFGFAPPVLGTTLVGFTAIDTHLQIPRIQQASASFERQLGDNMMVQFGYLGAWGTSLDRSRLVNNAPPGPGPLPPRRPFQTISFAPGTELPADIPVARLTFPVGPINLLESTGRSEYNSGWVLAKRSFSQGLSFLASYTYARSFTDAPSFRSPANESEVPQNSFDPRADWGPAGCDIRHRFVSSLIYKVPFSATAAGAGALTRVARGLLGGWQVSLIHQEQSGFPFTISVFGDTANAGSLLNVNPIRANAVPGVSPDLPADQRSAAQWFNTAAFVTPPAFTFGNVGRNSLVGPGLRKTDLALDREVPLAAVRLHLRVEAFNLFNAVNYTTPNRFVNTPQFGTITAAATPARQIQFVLRATF